ncbi:MAG: cysteine hydrolase [Bacteroidales bacterium]|nr:cysteine hydrolase [Bacteroidales bacterium]
MKKAILLVLSIILSINIINAQETKKKELKPALLVIDVQNAYIPWMDQSEKDVAFEYINAAIGLFEKFELPIIRVYHQDKEWGPAEDSEEFKFPSEINVKDDYPMVIKNYGNAFTKTDLDKLLREKEINTVFLCGLSATGCVLATHVGASDHDYKVFMIKSALLSPDAEQTDFIEEIMSTVSYGTLTFMLEYTQ